MNIKRYLIAGIAVFATFQVCDMIIHGQLLMNDYAALPSLWRPDMMSLMWIMWITGLVLSYLFVYVFVKGYEARGILEGVRYGLIIGIMMNGVGAFNQYVIYPVPLALAVQWFVYGMIEFIIAGVVAAAIYRPKAS